MIHIGICDDDSVFRNHLKEEIEKYFTNTMQDIYCHLFEDAEQLFAYDITSLQLLFLDIRLPGKSGLELAQTLQTNDAASTPILIFISSLSNYVFEAIHYAPFRFLRKEFLAEELPEALTAFLQKYHAPNASVCQIQLVEKGSSHMVSLHEIQYLEINLHYLDFHCTQQTYHVRGKLSAYESILCEHNFCRINQSCMVNLDYIRVVSNSSIVLRNGQELFLSRSYKAAFRSAYLKFERSQTHVLTI